MSDTNQQVAEIRWTASEYVEHEKGAVWYMALVAAAVTVSVVAFLLTREWITPVSIFLVIVGLGVFAGIKPKQKEFVLDGTGVGIGDEYYPYQDFRSFSVIVENNFETLYLKPVKRFAVPLTLYFPPDQAETIVSFIGNFIPYEKSELSGVDKMMARLKF